MDVTPDNYKNGQLLKIIGIDDSSLSQIPLIHILINSKTEESYIYTINALKNHEWDVSKIESISKQHLLKLYKQLILMSQFWDAISITVKHC